MDKAKTLYTAKLHEFVTVDNNTEAVRVPGGWIYNRYNSVSKLVTSTFVPYNDEWEEI